MARSEVENCLLPSCLHIRRRYKVVARPPRGRVLRILPSIKSGLGAGRRRKAAFGCLLIRPKSNSRTEDWIRKSCNGTPALIRVLRKTPHDKDDHATARKSRAGHRLLKI